MLTDAQVELVARRYCVLRGIDPEMRIPMKPNPFTVVLSREVQFAPAWAVAGEFVRQRAAMDEAFRLLDIVAPGTTVVSPSPFPELDAHDRPDPLRR